MICLIHQSNYLLDQQIAGLEALFIKGGGYSEQLATARLAHRAQQKCVPEDGTDPQIPACPQCGQPMVLRSAHSGKNAGKSFWGCSAYPECRGLVNV